MQALKETDFNWHADLPDVPGKSAGEMKAFFDAPTRVLLAKINEIIGDGEATDLSTLLGQLGKKADAAEYLLMIRGLQEAHNGQNELLKELDERLTAEAAALKESDAALNERADYVGHDVSVLRGEYEDWKLMEYEVLKARLAQLEDLLQNTDTGGSAQGISGEMSIEDLPLGMAYAEGDASLSYLVDAEMGTYEALDVETGSCIFKTVGQVVDESSSETVDGAITVYIVPRYHILTHPDYGYSGTLFMTKITPRHDMYGMAYSVSTVSNNIMTATTISPSMQNTSSVPTAKAVMDYVADNMSGGASSGMTELNCWDGNLDDLALGLYYVVDGASFNYYDSNGEWMSTSVANGATLIVGERMDWSTGGGRGKYAAVLEPDGYRYLG